MSKGRNKQSQRFSWFWHMETTWKRTKSFYFAFFFQSLSLSLSSFSFWRMRMSMTWLCISKDIQFDVSHSPNEPNLISIFICERIFKLFKLLMDYNRDKESIKLLVDILSHLSRFVHIVIHSFDECTRMKEKITDKINVYCHTTMNL